MCADDTKIYRLAWPGKGFGNALVLAQLTRILADNGVPAFFSHHKLTVGLIDETVVPIYDGEKFSGWNVSTFRGSLPSNFSHKICDYPWLDYFLQDFSRMTGKKIKFDRPRHNHIPVSFKEVPGVPEADVALCTTSGPWSPYRNWPHFDALKSMMAAEGITFIDLHMHNLMGMACLTAVKKAKLYVGLETGMSHYVSKFANGKALIIQGGFAPFFFWAWPYEYDAITSVVDCEYRPCFMDREFNNKGTICTRGMSCISSIPPQVVMSGIRERLGLC